jgi:geranylgeranyl reductase family protein
MYDVAILGAGPAGSEAFFRLAGAGIRTILIEKRAKGDSKPCGGAIPQKEVALFGELPSDVYDFIVRKAVLKTTDAEDMILKVEGSGLAGYGVKREIYDTYLMERAGASGGEIRFRERVLDIRRHVDATSVLTDKGTYRARFVLAALGSRGLFFFKKLGWQRYPYAKGGYAVQKVLEGELFEASDTLYFHFQPEWLRAGYFWVFPKKGCTYVGCGEEVGYLRGKNLMGMLDSFVAARFGSPKVTRIERGLIPFCPARPFHRNGVFLLGDSAGLANPFHGGGIFEARLSGKLAAEAVKAYFTHETEDPGRDYAERIENEIIGSGHRWDDRIKRIFLSPVGRRKLWALGAQDEQVREALGQLYASAVNHLAPFRTIMERVFQRMQQEMEETIRPYQARINRGLSSLLPQDTPLDRIMSYSLLGEGKRLRASLVCLMTEALGGEVEKAMPTALSYELAHTASLVHDDIIDKAKKRRGKPSVVSRYGLDGAIVSGDALLIKAFEVLITGYRDADLSKERLTDLVDCGTRSGIMACQGELLDGEMGKAPEKYTVADYIRLVGLKTAALIEGPCEAAAILAGREEVRSAVRSFGRHLGIAFQILDDAKDLLASEEASLKGRFADFRNGKPNLYLIWILRKVEEADRNRLKKLLARGRFHEEDIEFVFRLSDETGVFDSAKRLFMSYLGKAGSVLEGFPEGIGKKRLCDLVEAMGYWTNF